MKHSAKSRSAGFLWGGAALVYLGAVQACSAERAPAPNRQIELAAIFTGPQIGQELPVAKPELSPSAQTWGTYARPAWNGSAYLVLVESLAWRLDASGKELDSRPFRVPAMGKVASNGSDWLIVWPEGGGIRAARVSGAGVVLDPTGFQVVANATGRIEVASNGSEYLIVWGEGDIYGARVAATGTVIGAPIAIAQQPGAQAGADIAWAGSNYLVAWADEAGAGNVVAARVRSDGSVLDPQGIQLSTHAAAEHWPHVASSGTESLVVWERAQNEIRAARVSPAGAPLDQSPLLLASGSDYPDTPRVTWNGAGYIVHYRIDPCSDAGGTSAVLVLGSGSIVAPPPNSTVCGWRGLGDSPGESASDRAGKHLLVVTGNTGSGNADQFVIAFAASSSGSLGTWQPRSAVRQTRPRIAADLTRALVVWEHPLNRLALPPRVRSQMAAARLDATGAMLDPDRIAIRYPSGSPFRAVRELGVAASQSHFFVKVNDDGPHYGSFVTNAGAVLSTVELPVGGFVFDNSSVLSDGTQFLATWVEMPTPAARARRFSTTGAPIDATPLTLPLDIAISEGVWDGASYFGVWASSTGVKAARLSSAAVPLTGPTSIAAGECPDVSWDGTNHFVVWSNAGTVYGARVDTQGAVLDASGLALGTGSCPRVAYNGSHHVVVWAEETSSAVRATRVTPGGAIADSSPVTIQTPAFEPDVASFGDGRALIVYRHPDLTELRSADRVWVRVLSDRCDCDGGACDGSVCIGASLDAGADGSSETGVDGAAGTNNDGEVTDASSVNDSSTGDTSTDDAQPTGGSAGAGAAGTAGIGADSAGGRSGAGSAGRAQQDSGVPKRPNGGGSRDDSGCAVARHRRGASWHLLLLWAAAAGFVAHRRKKPNAGVQMSLPFGSIPLSPPLFSDQDDARGGSPSAKLSGAHSPR